MSFQYFMIGMKLVLISTMRRIHKFKRILMYYLRPGRRDWVNWDSKLFQRDTQLLEEVFLIEELQLVYIPSKVTKTGIEYYITNYNVLIDDC